MNERSPPRGRRALAAAFLLLAGAAGVLAQDAAPAATLSYVLGKVELGRGGGFRDASVGQSLYAGDRIRTGTDGQAEISFGGASRLRLAERTDMVIPDRAENQGGLLQRVSVSLGSVWANIRRLASNESFEVEGGHSIGGVKGTRFQLIRTAFDRWRLASGRLAVRMRQGSGAPVTLTDGQEVSTEGGRLGRPRRGDAGDMRRGYLHLNRQGASQWRALLTKLLAAERRIVSRARGGPGGPGKIRKALEASRKIGTALADAEREIDAFLASRRDDDGDQDHGTGDLPRLLDSTMSAYDRMHAELEGLEDAEGPGGPQRPGVRPGARPPGANQPTPEERRALQAIRQAMTAFSTYHQPLQRAMRRFQRHVDKIPPKLKVDQAKRITQRIESGYRLVQNKYQQLRQANKKHMGGRASPQVRRAAQQLDSRWRTIGRDFRIFQQLKAQVIASLKKN